jgi:hypothetical protein
LTQQSPEFAPVMEAGFPADAVAPFVGALLSPDVPCNGETFVVGGGRAARVVLATVPGAVGMKTIDDYLANFDQVMATDELEIPKDANKEVVYECAQLGIDLAKWWGKG